MASVNSFTDYGFLKRMYSGVIRTSLNNDLPLYSRLEDVLDQVNIGGAGLYWGVRMGRHHGTHAIGEDATISTPTRATEKQAAATPAEVWGQAQLTAKVMAMAKNSADAFETAVTNEMQNLMESTKQTLGRQVIGNKVSGNANVGILGLVVGTVSGSATVPVDNCNPTQFYPGQLLVIGTAAELDAATGVAAVVSSVSVTTATSCTLTMTASVTLADNDLIAEGTNASATSNGYTRELVGLNHIVDNAGTLFDIDPTTYTKWKATVHSASSQPWSEKLLNTLLVAIRTKAGREKLPNVLAMHDLTYLEFEEDKRPDRRYVAKELAQGFEDRNPQYTFMDAVLEEVMDPWVQVGSILAVNTKVLGMAWPQPLDFFDADGNDRLRVANKTTVQFIYGGIGQMVAFERHCHGRLDSISVDLTNIQLRE